MDPGHVREFTPIELKRIALACGLTLKSLTLVDSWTESPPIPEAIKRVLDCERKSTDRVLHRDNIVAVFSSQ